MSCTYIDLLLCFNLLQAYTIEILLIILTSIAIILGILGIIFIPWKVTYASMEILFIIGFILIILSIVVVVIIFYLRNTNKIKRQNTRILIISSISVVFSCFISLILFVIIAFITISDLNNKETIRIEEVIEQTGEIKSVKIIENDATTKTKRIISILIIAIIIAILIIMILLWVSEYLRLIYSTNLSYKEFIKKGKESALKHPALNGLTVVGHDKYGFPIFGSKQGNQIIIKGIKTKFEEKIEEKTHSREYFNKEGKINLRYYEKYHYQSIERIKEKETDNFKEKEKYLEKYFDGNNAFQNYTNFGNKTILNFEDNNNSINP